MSRTGATAAQSTGRLHLPEQGQQATDLDQTRRVLLPALVRCSASWKCCQLAITATPFWAKQGLSQLSGSVTHDKVELVGSACQEPRTQLEGACELPDGRTQAPKPSWLSSNAGTTTSPLLQPADVAAKALPLQVAGYLLLAAAACQVGSNPPLPPRN